MGKVRSDRDSIAALQAALADLDREIDRTGNAVTEAARSKRVPDITGDATPGLEGISAAWTSACETLAVRAAIIAARVDDVMAALEDKPQPTAKERLRAALRNLLAMRFGRSGWMAIDVLVAALADADSLHGMLSARRGRLVAMRQRVESDLVELGGHRQALADNLAEAASHEGRPISGASVLVEQYLQTVQDFLVEINRQLTPINVLVNKLTIEAERAILLAGILSPRRGGSTAGVFALDRESLPHLTPLLELHDTDMLSSIEVERRKTKIDGRFLDTFRGALDKATGTAYVKGINAGVGNA